MAREPIFNVNYERTMGDELDVGQDTSPAPTCMKNDVVEEGEITEGDVSRLKTSPYTQGNVWPLGVESNGTNVTRTWSPAKAEPLTAEELDRAKSLVLDLLGWGVTPEYLVNIGVSASALYRIFTDLGLRLPINLVVSTTTPSLAP